LFLKLIRIFQSNILRSGIIYAISNILNSAVPFLLLPVLVRNISTENMGIISIFQIIVGVLMPVIGLSTNGAVSVKYFKYTKKEFSEFVRACLILITTSFIIVILICFLFYDFCYPLVKFPFGWIYLPIIFAYFQAVNNLLLSILQNSGEASKYAIINIFYTLTNLGLSLFLIFSFSLDWKGRVLGQTISVIILFCYTIYYLTKKDYLKGEFKIVNFASVLKFGAPLIPNYLIGTISGFWGHLLINSKLSTSDLGIYFVLFQYSSVFLIVASAFNLSFSPWLMQKLSEDKVDKVKIVRYTYFYFLGLVLFFLVLSFSFFLLKELFIPDKMYLTYFNIFYILTLSFVFNGMHMIVVNFIFFVEKVYYVTANTVLFLIINITLSSALIDKFGIIGVSLIHLFVSFFSLIVVWAISYRLYRMPWFNKLVWLKH